MHYRMFTVLILVMLVFLSACQGPPDDTTGVEPLTKKVEALEAKAAALEATNIQYKKDLVALSAFNLAYDLVPRWRTKRLDPDINLLTGGGGVTSIARKYIPNNSTYDEQLYKVVHGVTREEDEKEFQKAGEEWAKLSPEEKARRPDILRYSVWRLEDYLYKNSAKNPRLRVLGAAISAGWEFYPGLSRPKSIPDAKGVNPQNRGRAFAFTFCQEVDDNAEEVTFVVWPYLDSVEFSSSTRYADRSGYKTCNND